MLARWFNDLRCRLAYALMSSSLKKGLGLASRISPDTTSLVRHRPRRPPALPVPPRSHLIYHQAAVDRLAAENSLATLAAQLPPEDEVLLLDVGGTVDAGLLAPFARHAWSGYAACQTPQPEQRSYTFGLNLAVAGLKAPTVLVWRTDYVYPPDLFARYRQSLERGAWFAAPYDVLIGLPEVNAAFVREQWARVSPFDETYWAEHSRRLSLYEFQDPALFAIRRDLWDEIGGLNHELWGYGWQFAEFAVRVRTTCPPGQVDYFGGPPPLHQTHGGSQMFEPQNLKEEAQAGIRRFQQFLGGEAAYHIYRMKQFLPPRGRS